MPWQKGQSGNPRGPKATLTREEKRRRARLRQRKWYAANIDRLREYNALRQREWCAANRERSRLTAKKWRQTHPEVQKLARERWCAGHPKYWMAREQSQRDVLANSYIAELLGVSPRILPKSLIEFKRAQLMLLRQLRRNT